ncbi:MAG: response regulator transcription factor [Methylococcales bacterium]
MKNIRILLVDDHQMFRNALRSLLEKAANLEVVGETGDASEIVSLVRSSSAQIVCMDIGMPSMNGIEATRQLIAAFPTVKVIALSTYSEQKYVQDMMAAGASAYITKVEAAEELLRAIMLVLQNRKYLCPDVTEAVINVMAQDPKVAASSLTNRERQVLRLVAMGNTSTIIAERLNISLSTVEVHRRNILRKLNLHNAVELTHYAMSHDLMGGW